MKEMEFSITYTVIPPRPVFCSSATDITVLSFVARETFSDTREGATIDGYVLAARRLEYNQRLR